MTDYTKVTNFTLKDSTQAFILGSDFETEFSNVATHSATKANKVAAAVTGNLAKLTGTGDLADSGLDSTKTPQVDDVVIFEKSAVFDAEYDTGSGGSVTITWDNGNKQKRTLTGNATLTFTAPSGAANLVLHIVNSGGARTITFPAAVLWPGGVKPAATAGIDIYSFYYDGTNYFGVQAPNFS